MGEKGGAVIVITGANDDNGASGSEPRRHGSIIHSEWKKIAKAAVPAEALAHMTYCYASPTVEKTYGS